MSISALLRNLFANFNGIYIRFSPSSRITSLISLLLVKVFSGSGICSEVAKLLTVVCKVRLRFFSGLADVCGFISFLFASWKVFVHLWYCFFL